MDNSLKQLESRLQDLVPKGLSDEGRANCEDLIDTLAIKEAPAPADITQLSPVGLSWKSTAAAAAIMLGIGMSSGWYLGQSSPTVAPVAVNTSESTFLASAFEVLDHQSWLEQDQAPEILVNADGQVTEARRVATVVEEVIKHHDSGHLINHRFVESRIVKEPIESF